MAVYSREYIERLRLAVPLERVVSEYTELHYGGPNRLCGLCPFLVEKTASFYVRTLEERYHCFGCGSSGDVFKFLMQKECISFLEAVRRVAHYARFPEDEHLREDRR